MATLESKLIQSRASDGWKCDPSRKTRRLVKRLRIFPKGARRAKPNVRNQTP